MVPGVRPTDRRADRPVPAGLIGGSRRACSRPPRAEREAARPGCGAYPLRGGDGSTSAPPPRPPAGSRAWRRRVRTRTRSPTLAPTATDDTTDEMTSFADLALRPELLR